jgi:hypothetical protein
MTLRKSKRKKKTPAPKVRSNLDATDENGASIFAVYAGQERCLTVRDANDIYVGTANYWFARENGDLFTFCNSRTFINYHDLAIDDYRNSVSGTVRVTFGNPTN